MSSDSASSKVTYTSISSHEDPLAWAVDFFGLQEPDSLEAAPTLLDYVLGPKEPKHVPLSPEFDPEPELPDDDMIVAEDQPYADYASPVSLSLGYVADSDPKEDLEEDSDDGPVDYLANRGDDDDDGSFDDEEK
nr:hypothetical protein [Tanacetum cinerariifolium]